MYYPKNPAVPMRILASSFNIPNPAGFLSMMLKTFNELVKVTKKTVQRNFLERMNKMNMVTKQVEKYQKFENARKLVLK